MAEHHKIAAIKRGSARNASLREAVDQAMRAIAEEMKGNDGIYPRNGGAVSMAELARRAGINESSLYKSQNVELKERATIWLRQLQQVETIGRKRVRRHMKEVLSDWKERFVALDSHNIVTHLRLQQLEAENLKLKEEALALREQLFANRSSVASLAEKRRR